MARIEWSETPDLNINGATPSDSVALSVSDSPENSAAEIITSRSWFDMNYDLTEPPYTTNSKALSVTNNSGGLPELFQALRPEIATIDNSGQVRFRANGVDYQSGAAASTLLDDAVRFQVRVPGFASQGASQRIERVWNFPGPAIAVTGFADGTLSKAILDDMLALVAGKTASAAAVRFFESNNNDLDNPAVVYNSELFAAGMDFSGIAVMSSPDFSGIDPDDDIYPMTLISPRHAICAGHVESEFTGSDFVGTEHVFRRLDGTYQKVSVADKTPITRTLSTGETADTDLVVVQFDTPVTGATSYPVMPAYGWEEYLPSCVLKEKFNGAYANPQLPFLRKGQHDTSGNLVSSVVIDFAHAVPKFASEITPHVEAQKNTGKMLKGYAGDITGANLHEPVNTLAGWHEPIRAGCSGSPSFLLINGQLVLISTEWNINGSHELSFFANEIESAMQSMAAAAGDPAASSYALGRANLSDFKRWPVDQWRGS